ncbi:hypothetical protein [Lysinibacillus sp. RC79]|uniref:hypothetical protein n=1 Tax=Lysinibacillus sp. RC79 TaxID=3156296 RepID=UPI0035159072
MIEFGNKISELGYILIPFSFFAYIIFRPLDFIWKKGYFKLVKSIWYFSSGIGMLFGDVRVEIVVMFIAFIESYDLIFQYLEDRKAQKKEKK